MERERNISITGHLYLVVADQGGWGVEGVYDGVWRMENEQVFKDERYLNASLGKWCPL